MILKEKPCKGINKARMVKGCDKLTMYRTFGLCGSCLSDFLFNSDAGKVVFNKINLKVKSDTAKAFKSNLREKLKTLGEYKAEARKSFQKWIRLRDSDKNCISCNSSNAKDWHGSHYFSANLYSGMIFDEDNVHKSCDYCNVFLHGNITGYRKGLIQRYGVDYVEKLEAKSDLNRVKKYTKEELIKIKNKYDLLNKNRIFVNVE
jgi:hypothetical protein